MPHPDTIAVHAGEPGLDRRDAPITPDITVGSASGYRDLAAVDAAMAAHRGYGRWGTENHRQLEAALAGLEGMNAGSRLDTVVVGSGMAAIAVALLSELNHGDHVLVANDCYGTTMTFVRDDLSRFGITASIVDFQDLNAVKGAIGERTRVLLCEICTNPLIRVPDLEALSRIAHDAGALLLVDNTVPTPVLCQPLRWGADAVIYSATKNLSGHADVIGGAIVGKPAWIESARAFSHTFGPTLGPLECPQAGPVPRESRGDRKGFLPGAGQQPLLPAGTPAAAGWRRRLVLLRGKRRQRGYRPHARAARHRPADAEPGPRRYHREPPGLDLASRADARGASAYRDQRRARPMLSRDRAPRRPDRRLRSGAQLALTT